MQGTHRLSRSESKHRAIVDAATAAFLDRGFDAVSMDDIAAAAGVSKRTVYAHFTDKAQLFIDVVTDTVSAVSDPVHAEARRVADSGDLAADLRDLARRQLQGVMTPRLIALRRLVIAEAVRFPQLAQAFYDLGPGRTINALTETFARLHARGLLRCDDPRLAATQFNWLVMSDPINRAMFSPTSRPDPAALQRAADTAVQTFLTAYRPTGGHS